jgi:hypothetical protein
MSSIPQTGLNAGHVFANTTVNAPDGSSTVWVNLQAVFLAGVEGTSLGRVSFFQRAMHRMLSVALSFL